VKLALLRTAVRQTFLPRAKRSKLSSKQILESGYLSFGSDVGPFVDFKLKFGTTAVPARAPVYSARWGRLSFVSHQERI
jgi:hypothetical protein